MRTNLPCKPLSSVWLTRCFLRDIFFAMSENLLSIRMHASLDGQHLSGAERLVEQDVSVEDEMLQMVTRALQHPRGRADQINLRIDEIPRKKTVAGKLLDFSGFLVDNWEKGRLLVGQLLAKAGVTSQAVSRSIEYLSNGAAPDGNSMRGAMLIDARTGERLETDQERGIRVSRMDLTPLARTSLRQQLAELNLDNSHVLEALTLASKVLSTPQVIAELCWSDDPDYTAGYVASESSGYQRISQLKPAGEVRGGRAFFISQPTDDMTSLIQYLECTPYLIQQIGAIKPSIPWQEP